MIGSETFSERCKAWALEEGFDHVAVGRVSAAQRGASLIDWLERGYHASMEYLNRNREKRLDPQRLFSGCRSVVSVGLQYYPLGQEDDPEGDLWPRVARYARGLDYHDLMLKRLRRLAARIEAEHPGCVQRPYVDTGPVLEREVAASVGLGAVGKNTLVLHPAGGSWFLLGELFLNLELEQDPGVEDLCGSCTACLDACPTGALREPYVLDSNLCISYWTIEHRGALPIEARDLAGDWVFGCDACQEVCPANSSVVPAANPEFRLPEPRASLDLESLLRISREDYVEAFRGSPMKRAKQEGLARNAATAMGNRGDQRYVEPLGAALRGESVVIASHSAWALGRIGGERAKTALTEHLEIERRGEVRVEIERALGGP